MKVFKIKVRLLGVKNTGKTCFNNNNKFQKGEFQEISHYIKTINNIKFKIQILELDWFELSLKSLNFDSSAIMLFYDSMDKDSFEKIKRFYFSISDYKKIFFLVRSKYDIKSNIYNESDIVSDEEALEFADENNIIFAHFSSIEKYETGIDYLLNKIITEFLKLKI